MTTNRRASLPQYECLFEPPSRLRGQVRRALRRLRESPPAARPEIPVAPGAGTTARIAAYSSQPRSTPMKVLFCLPILLLGVASAGDLPRTASTRGAEVYVVSPLMVQRFQPGAGDLWSAQHGGRARWRHVSRLRPPSPADRCRPCRTSISPFRQMNTIGILAKARPRFCLNSIPASTHCNSCWVTLYIFLIHRRWFQKEFQ